MAKRHSMPKSLLMSSDISRANLQKFLEREHYTAAQLDAIAETLGVPLTETLISDIKNIPRSYLLAYAFEVRGRSKSDRDEITHHERLATLLRKLYNILMEHPPEQRVPETFVLWTRSIPKDELHEYLQQFWNSLCYLTPLFEASLKRAHQLAKIVPNPGGRPWNGPLQETIEHLAVIYHRTTGRRPRRASINRRTGFPDGPFYRFVHACLAPLEPLTGSLGKLEGPIRQALEHPYLYGKNLREKS